MDRAGLVAKIRDGDRYVVWYREQETGVRSDLTRCPGSIRNPTEGTGTESK